MSLPRSEDWMPGFIVIGAAKSATTWLQKQLQQNPHIFMPAPEPHFFSREFDSGIEYYRSFFDARTANTMMNGEKSADYLSHPRAPARLSAIIPSCKLIVLLRDPVQRAYSDYKMFFRRGTVRGTPEAYLSSADNQYPRFLEDGLYARHLRRWLDYFPQSSLLVLMHDNVFMQPQAIVEAASSHIGMATMFNENAARNSENDSRARLLPMPMRKALSPFKNSVKQLRGRRAFENLRSIFAREIRYPELSHDLEQRLRAFYRQDISDLERLIGRDLSTWKKSRPPTSSIVPDNGEPCYTS